MLDRFIIRRRLRRLLVCFQREFLVVYLLDLKWNYVGKNGMHLFSFRLRDWKFRHRYFKDKNSHITILFLKTNF